MLGFVAVANQLTFTAMAAAPAAADAAHLRSAVSVCSTAADGGACAPVAGNGLQVILPSGAQQCPASAIGASCATSDNGAGQTPGTASIPPGQTACPSDASSPLSTPAACSDTVLAGGSSSNDDSGAPAAFVERLTLTSSAAAPASGNQVLLTATAASGVTGTGKAIEIFDTTAGVLVGSCSRGGQCAVAYSANAGVHNFQAFIAPPTATALGGSPLSSNVVSVGWLGLSLASTQGAVGPGKTTTLTATSTIPVEQFGYAIELFDLSNMGRIAFCSRGTKCSISLTQAVSGSRSVVAAVGKPTTTFSKPDIWAVSDHLTVTWLSIAIAGSSTFQVGGTIHLTATSNADLTNTAWSIGILDEKGRLVGQPCKKGSSCSADVAVGSGATPQFSAVIGALPSPRTETRLGQVLQKVSGPSSLVDLQTQSQAIQPTRLLWGVDSCKAFTGDATGEVYPTVAKTLGTPDFWGRYLTSTVCPGLSWPEIFMAQRLHMGILPIYNDYNCSDVVGYDTGMGYAQAATGVAAHIHIPTGRVIAIDIEPPGAACPGAANIDLYFIRGWYDGVTAAGYVPVFYGNGTAGSEFGSAWCAAQSEDHVISQTSYLWSFEPSLDTGGWSKANAPEWQPKETGCPDNVAAWQYQLGSNSPDQDVDADEVLSILPLWYP